MKTDEVDQRLYKIYDETMFRIDTGADISVVKPTEKHDEIMKVIMVEDFDGNSRSKEVWRKN